MKIEIAKEWLEVFGAIFLLIISIFGQGVIVWALVNAVIWVFNINYHLDYFPQAVVLGVIISVITKLIGMRD